MVDVCWFSTLLKCFKVDICFYLTALNKASKDKLCSCLTLRYNLQYNWLWMVLHDLVNSGCYGSCNLETQEVIVLIIWDSFVFCNPVFTLNTFDWFIHANSQVFTVEDSWLNAQCVRSGLSMTAYGQKGKNCVWLLSLKLDTFSVIPI
jgi:hypothetical protein